MSLLDEIRSEKETWQTITFAGFDPDLHTSGLAKILVDVSSTGRKRLLRVALDVICIPRKLKGLNAANHMSQQVASAGEMFRADRALIEGQQLYPRDEVPKRTLVAQGNDLLMLALVSGSAFCAFARHGGRAEIKLPAQWKGQRSKDSMHKKAVSEILKVKSATINGRVFDLTGMLPDTRRFRKASGQHAMDALCMALRLAGYRV